MLKHFKTTALLNIDTDWSEGAVIENESMKMARIVVSMARQIIGLN